MSYDVSIPIIYYAGIQFTFWSHNYFDKSMNKEHCQILEMEKKSLRRKLLRAILFTHIKSKAFLEFTLYYTI